MAQSTDLNPYQSAQAALEERGISFAEVESKDVPPMIGSGLLMLYGLSRRSLGGLFLAGIGGGLLYRQLLSKNVLPQKDPNASNHATRSKSSDQFIELEESIIIQQPIEDVFAFWSDLQNLPRFMDHIKN